MLGFDALKKKFGGSNNKVYGRFHELVQNKVFDAIRLGLLGYQETPIWTQKAFNNRVTACRSRLTDIARQVIGWLGSMMMERQHVLRAISNKISYSNCFVFRASFLLLMFNAIKIPITTNAISPIAYNRYLLNLFSVNSCCLIFLKNFIIGLLFGL